MDINQLREQWVKQITDIASVFYSDDEIATFVDRLLATETGRKRTTCTKKVGNCEWPSSDSCYACSY
jgi:hypothetical protein